MDNLRISLALLSIIFSHTLFATGVDQNWLIFCDAKMSPTHNNDKQDALLNKIIDFKSSELCGADFTNVILVQGQLDNEDMQFSDFMNSYVFQTSFRYANVSNTNFQNAVLWQNDFSHAELMSADFTNAVLVESNFSNADLGSADLTNANLQNANLEYAELYHAQLEGANLSGAKLIGTDLIGAEIDNTTFSCDSFRNTLFEYEDYGNIKIPIGPSVSYVMSNKDFIPTYSFDSEPLFDPHIEVTVEDSYIDCYNRFCVRRCNDGTIIETL